MARSVSDISAVMTGTQRATYEPGVMGVFFRVDMYLWSAAILGASFVMGDGVISRSFRGVMP